MIAGAEKFEKPSTCNVILFFTFGKDLNERYIPYSQSIMQSVSRLVLIHGSIKYNYLDHCPRQRRDNERRPK